MNWWLIRKFPKFVIVAGVFVGSTALFLIWWQFRNPGKSGGVAAAVERPKPVDIKSHLGHLILADNDLYDVDSGELLAKNWLKEEMPDKIFWDAASNSMLAQYEKGFVRYAPDGTELARLVLKYRFAFGDDYKWILFAQDKDIWRADVDWKEFKLVNQRKITSIEQFNDLNFAGNIVVGTDKTLVVRNMMKLLRVDLGTGDVHPVRIPLGDIGKRRSPDSKSVVGLQGGQFYCYDVDGDTAKSIPVGRGVFNDYQWLGNDRCAAIAAGKTVVLYDRLNNTLNEVVGLPLQCSKIGEPSPDGRFVFCYSWKGGALVDLEKKTAVPVAGGEGIGWVSNDSYIFSREVPDSNLRGIWLQTVGEGERRLSTEPFLVSKSGDSFVLLKSPDLVIFATKHGLSKINTDGKDLKEFAGMIQPPSHFLGIEKQP